MPREARHFKDEIQDLLDHRLGPEARPEVEQHLESCEECRREFEALQWTRQFARRQSAAQSAPAKLEKSILAALDLEDSQSRARAASAWSWFGQRRAILAYGLMLAISAALALSYFLFRRTPPAESALASAIARDYQAYRAEKLPLTLETGEVKELERFFSAEGVAFDTRVFDLSMMNYHLTGGRVHQLIGRQSALFVYRGKDGRILICQMYPGQTTELPQAGATLRENNGIRFHIYRAGGLTLAFWQEGAITCALASDGDSEEVVQLAFAKAVKI
jgi:anti-sigma factor RsiW